MAERQNLVLVPGLSDDGALWTHQIRHLADIADAKAADNSGHDTVEAMARSVLDKAPQRFRPRAPTPRNAAPSASSR
jgi:hypothetical protein